MHFSIPRKALASAIALVLAAPMSVSAQTFYEGFDISAQMPPVPGCHIEDFPSGAGTYPFPAGWLLRNVDNRTPMAGVAYVNDAWEVREDFSFDVSQCAAFSTSWYSPGGAADDWMWTPAIALPSGSSSLSWRAVAYDPSYRDGYEVRVMVSPNVPGGGTGAIGNQLTSSSQIFSTAAEQTSWTVHLVDVSTYAGQTIYVGFHNNSNDKFLLLIDDVSIFDATPSLVALAPPEFNAEYVHVPEGIGGADIYPGVIASNQGGVSLTNVQAATDLYVDGQLANPDIFTSNQVALIPVGANAALTFLYHGTVFSGEYAFGYRLAATETPSEPNVMDNAIVLPGVTVGGNEWTRFQGPATATVGIGAGDGGDIGTQFTLKIAATFEGVRFGLGQYYPPDPPDPVPWPGQSLVARLWSFDSGSGKPSAVLATTVPIITTAEGGIYDVAFAAGPQALPAGTYVVTLAEPVGGPAMPLPVGDTRFKLTTVWVNWPSIPFGDWVNIETFGPSFQNAVEISLLTELSLFRDGFETVPLPPPAGAAGVQFTAAAPIKVSTEPRRRAPIKALSKARVKH